MDLLSLDVEPEVSEREQPQPEPPRPAPLPLTFHEVNHGYRPGWGLACSAVAHEIAFFGLLFLSIIYSRIVPPWPPELTRVIDLSNPTEVVYLPSLGGGSEGNGQPGGEPGSARPVPSAKPARSSKGFSYPGPQPIVSDPPKANNSIQTILRPALKNPPVLQPLIPLPNIVQMANTAPPALDVTAIQPAMPAFHPAVTPPIEPPKLTLPASDPQNLPLLSAVAEPPLPVPSMVEKPREPRPEEVSTLPVRGTDRQSLLALSPVPAPPELSEKIPLGEARGRFAISTEPSVAAPGLGPGSKAEGVPSVAAAIGSQEGAGAGNAAAEVALGSGSSGQGSTHGVGGGTGNGMGKGKGSVDGGAGTGMGKGSGRGGTGTNSGRGSGTGSGFGEGPGHSSGSGSGAGSGPSRGAFPGITIQRGGSATGGAGSLRPTPAPRQTSYGMTIVSTASSGGGLAEMGVFSNEKVYTVFLDMRLTVEDPAPSWTLQYALLRQPGADAGTGSGVTRSQQRLAPPFPVVKEMPQLPAELVHKYSHRLVVVYAIMDTDGKLEQVSVKQSPDARLIAPVLEALQKWVFRPAELNGQPVSLKILLGIPLSPPE